MKENSRKILFLLLGVLTGCILTFVIVWFVVQARVNYLSTSLGLIAPTENAADPEIYQTLADADAAIQAGNPQAAIDLIATKIDHWNSPQDKATGYQLLAVAEFNLGFPQKAIPYAQKMVEIDYNAFSLLLLAQAYDSAGDLQNALSIYQQILTLDGNDPRVDYVFVRDRASALSKALGTPVP